MFPLSSLFPLTSVFRGRKAAKEGFCCGSESCRVRILILSLVFLVPLSECLSRWASQGYYSQYRDAAHFGLGVCACYVELRRYGRASYSEGCPL